MLCITKDMLFLQEARGEAKQLPETRSCKSWKYRFRKKKEVCCAFNILHIVKVIKSSRLDGTFKTIVSIHQPDLHSPISKPRPLVPHSHLLNTSANGYSTTLLGNLFQFLIHLSMKKFFLISNLNLTSTSWDFFLLSYCFLPEERDQWPLAAASLRSS